jgi:hypothetical protein
LQSGELGGYISFAQVIHQVGLQPVLGVQNNGNIFRVRTQISVVLADCLLIMVNIFLTREENDLVWIGWFSYGARRFYQELSTLQTWF